MFLVEKMVAVHFRVKWEISRRVPCLRAISLISSNSCIRIRIMKVCTRIFRYSSRCSWRAVAICFSWVSYTFCERCCSITRFCCRLDSVIGPRFGWLGWRLEGPNGSISEFGGGCSCRIVRNWEIGIGQNSFPLILFNRVRRAARSSVARSVVYSSEPLGWVVLSLYTVHCVRVCVCVRPLLLLVAISHRFSANIGRASCLPTS